MSPVDQAFAQFPRSWHSVKALVKYERAYHLAWLTEKIHFLLKIATTNSLGADFWIVLN